MIPAISDKMKLTWEKLCRRFSLAEIESATKNFDEELFIGRGGFGRVYRGIFDDGSIVAIKRLDSGSKQGASEFWAEIEMLSRLRHCHLVSLVGYCNEEDEMILVYELMPHGSLSDHLHKLGTRLSWLQRLKICIGAARGLDYLHSGTGTHHGVIHRDIKSSNILLDDNWEAKISDFGLSKIGPTNQPSTSVSTAIKGTTGYLDPEYSLTGRLTRKSDVYSFGVVLLEVLCGRPAVDRSRDEEQWGLVGWAKDCINEGKLLEIVDSTLNGQILLNCSSKFSQIALKCVHNRPKERPTMAEVVVDLEFAFALQERLDYSEPDYVEPDYAATPAKKITYIRRIHNFFFPFMSIHSSGAPKFGSKTSSSSAPSSLTVPSTYSGRNSLESLPTPRSEGEILHSPTVKPFSFNELKNATRNFRPDSLLGEGGFGYVFKGWIDEFTLTAAKPGSGMVIAVKKLKPEGFQGHKEWLTEVNYLGQLHHPNLVKLIGYCSDGDNRLLVYEFMPKGSLENHLFRSGPQPLPWATRIKVAIGAARGLSFLHDAEEQVIYRDFKASNILLDAEFNAKLSDFGLAKAGPTGDRTHVSTQVMGTRGYAAPEYVATGRLTAKSDVYSFGVVLLELLSGHRAFDKAKLGVEQNLVDWARPYLGDKRKLFRIMDTKLEGQYPQKAAYIAASLAVQCLSTEPKFRPKMSVILASLEELQAPKGASKITQPESRS